MSSLPSRNKRRSTSASPASPAVAPVGTVVAVHALWTQEEAAQYLNVSTRYLRDSGCPRHLLPGNGRREKALVRYKPAAVMAWADSWYEAA